MSKARTNELTARQKEVAIGLALGKTNGEVADAMGITLKTLDTHRQAIMHKLGLRNNVELARYAISVGWTPLENQVVSPSS